MSETPKEGARNETPSSPPKNSHESKVRVFTYMAILFAAAFLLLLLAFLMQNRASQETISDLTESVSSVHNVVEENAELRQQVETLEEQLESLQEALEEAKATAEQNKENLSLAKQRLDALHTLNNIRALYNQGNYQEARDLIGQNEPLLEKHLEEYSQNVLSEEGRAIYDPLDAYRSLVDWLN